VKHLVGHARQHPVGEPGNRILFMHHHRLAQQRSHHAPGKGDVSAHAEHHVRFDPADLAQRLGKTTQQVERQQQLAQQPLPRRAVKRTQATS
jgi:hypothetical protein